MRTKIPCLLAVALLLAITPAAFAQWGTRPNDMHVYQNGYPTPGSQVPLTFRVTRNPGPNLFYQAAVSQGWRGIPIPGGLLPLEPDSFFFLSASGVLPQIFSGFGGQLDAQGIAQGSITIPAVPALDGFQLYIAFVVYDGNGKIQGISRAHKLQVLTRPQTAVCGNTPANNIEVVDLDAKTIVKAIPTGSFTQAPFYDLNCRHIYATTWAGLINQIDTQTNTILASFQFSTGVNSCVGGTTAMTSQGERIFVCNANASTPSIVEADPLTFKEVKNHTFPVSGAQPAGIAVRPFNSEAMITCFLTTGNLFKFDIETGAVTSLFPVNGSIDNPQDAVWRPQGDYVFVCEYGGTTSTVTPALWVYDSNFTLVRKVSVTASKPGAAGIAMSPDGTYLYCDVDHGGSPALAKVDTDPTSPGFLTVIKNIPFVVGWSSGGWMCRNYDGSKAYALLSNGLGELDTRTDTFSTTIVPTSAQPSIFNVRHRQDL